VHLVPAEHAHRRIIDDHHACDAIAGIGEAEHVHAWAERFALLADPGRLTLLLAIHAAPNVCVSDLAVAAGMNDTAVSQALRLLRAAGLVQAHKDGRIMRYRLIDDTTHNLLHQITGVESSTSS
jgi:ArsR family transcriptional regulator, lead/cadmium/zinc/bismuth-responsive transcriptional repressor